MESIQFSEEEFVEDAAIQAGLEIIESGSQTHVKKTKSKILVNRFFLKYGIKAACV